MVPELVLAFTLGKGPDPDAARLFVMQRANRAGYSRTEWACLDKLLHAESRYVVDAKNRRSSAYGLFQLLKLKPGTPIAAQWERGAAYIDRRYGDACAAWAHFQRKGWY